MKDKEFARQIRLTALCCAAVFAFGVSIPLVAEVTARGDGVIMPDGGAVYETQPPVLELPETEPPEIVTEITEESETPPSDISADGVITVLNTKTKETFELDLEEYLIGVVAAEMPYTFNSEALKAQAVAARSYFMYKLENGSGHDGADACTSYSHCAAYISEQGLIDKYGKDTAKKVLKKIGDAVRSTAGEIITYKNKPALALFHSRSWKYTEASENVWGGKLPYLVSVSTPEADSISTVTVTESELAKLFDSTYAVKVNTSEKKPTLTSEKNTSGRQSSLFYSGKELKAKKLRTLLGLKSCDFEYEKTADGYVFTVHGYGHGVGMSQYGANEMAKNGSTYKEILTHYYSGVKIEKLNPASS